MAAGNIYIFAFFTALVAVNLIFAEESALEQGSEFFDQVDVGAEAEREARSPNEEGGRPQERTFFNLFPVTTSCNYTSQAGSTCASCTQALRCLASGVGIVRNCRGLLPYCNGGRCSFIPGSACTSG
ncbi:uncharacterized protein LOC125069745 [Vanessa atalanta]|uniref:uncharacterized protein LOC125069745 n=1 Tax=Vanessa atalanta TaxID=42275 RepID=UPI001FCDB3F9|nr:uncharacterized protein LOC125069745 [Vanessa atalanta]